MQNQVTSTTEPLPKSDSQELNFTQILYAYVYNIGSPNNAQNSADTLDSFVKNIASQIPPESQPPKLRLLKIALEGVKSHHLAWQKIEGENSQTDTPDSIKNEIKKTLNIYKKYFLTKFSSDGNPDNCDPEIKDRLSNFNDGSEFLNSIMPSTDLSQLKTLAKSLNNYLLGLTIEAESKISESKDPAEKSEEINKIKTTLLVFPGGTSMKSKIVFACLAGSIARVQDGISALNDSSIESTLAKEYIDIFTAILAPQVREVSQIHTSACLLGALMVDRGKIAEVDNHHISPQEDIGLSDLMKFSHGFAKEIEKKLLLPRDELIEEYKALLATPGGEIEFSAINEFIEKAKNIFVEEATLEKAEENGKKNGFVIDSPYKLFNDEDIIIDTAKINASILISPEELLKKYLRLPTEEFKKELKNALQDPNATMEFDYLKHLPDPKDLFKIAISESGDELVTNRLDVKKITNLVDLFSSKETDDKAEDNEQKSKVFAGLITLRNILDGYKTGDNGFLFYLKFNNKFKEKTGSSFKDFFFEKRDGNAVVRDEFKQEKSILEMIKSRFEYFGKLFMEDSPNRSAPELQELLPELVLLENFGPGQEDREKFIALISKPENIAIKNSSQENLLNILYQFDEEAFKLAIETKPELITQIAEKNNKGLSLVNILAQKGDNELLLHVLEKYKEVLKSENDRTGSKALIEMIDQQELFLNIIKSNRLDVFEKVIKMVDDESLINFNKPYSFGGTMLCFTCIEERTEIAKMLISKKVDLDAEYERNGMTPFYIATIKGYTEIAKDLIENGADFKKANFNGMSPFMSGCIVGHTEIVKVLIEKDGIDLNQTSRDGTTPLYVACQKGHAEIVKALIAKDGINLNPTLPSGITPLYIACQMGHTAIAKALIEKDGINLNPTLPHGLTPLYIACQNGHIETVKALIGKGAYLNLPRTTDGQTPLIVACSNGHTEIVEALIKGGADLNLPRTSDGVTPLLMACANGHTEIVEALFDAGADLTLLKNSHGALSNFNCVRNIFFSNPKLDKNLLTPEMNTLINELIAPDAIQIRNRNVEKKAILQRQIAFNKENSELFNQLNSQDSIVNQNYDLEITPVRQSVSPETTEYRKNFKKEFANALLFLKFVAKEFSSSNVSSFTQEQRIEEMAKIYLQENNVAKESIVKIMKDIAENKEGLKDILNNNSSDELIKLSINISKREEMPSELAREASNSTEIVIKNVEKALTKFISSPDKEVNGISAENILPPSLSLRHHP